MPAGNLYGQPYEDFWQNPTAPVPPNVYQPLPYLPDRQDDPAGNLLSGPPEDHYWRNPVAPLPASFSQPLPYACALWLDDVNFGIVVPSVGRKCQIINIC